ncbi:hypothetical protein GRZ55_10950 [Chelativorans sp. ZYF759]|uniref:hypothetical protein n=1 Tax=Chelativorans sp. ZYF759 TaxID=2692213 RepID=UPI00145D56B0|nr:hypothetical protein [Chelativorans sp. ZYF759]NMG39760.1 hypothetical protein [Chelativorans sp. ZYF759]
MEDWNGMTNDQILIGCLAGTNLARWEGDRERMLAYQRRALGVLRTMATEEPELRGYYLRLAAGHAIQWGITLDGDPLPAGT